MPSRLQPPPSNANGLVGAYPNDLTNATTLNGGPGSITPTRKERPVIDTKRKQTLLSLLEALTELQKDASNNSTLNGSPVNMKKEKELEEPTEAADEQLQKAGAETFYKFQKRINNLDRELRNFANAARQLGSSVGILSSAFHLRERLAYVLFLFRENAADLFPRKIQRQSVEAFMDQRTRTQESSAGKRKRWKYKALPHSVRPVILDKPDVEDFPEQLQAFAKDVTTFLNRLNEFPEFADEAVNTAIIAFETDLRYWASCLKTYEGQFKYPAVQRYLHDLTSEMADHLDTITSSLSMFLEIGIPTIRFAQKHAAQNLLNLTTVATFFSAVTATTLQFSFDQVGKPLSDAVNSFWFLSLVFSIASAVNSLLGLTWKQAMYRSPGHRVPWWVLMWIKRTPLIFLVVSVAAFSVGLCLFAYSSNQSPVTSALTTVFTTFSSFGLVAVSAWFTFERWTFNRHRGKKWLMDVLKEARVELKRLPFVKWTSEVPVKHVKRASTMTNKHLIRVGTGIYVVGRRMSSVLLPRTRSQDSDDLTAIGNGEYALHGTMGADPSSSPVSPGPASISADRIPGSGDRNTVTPLPSSISAASLGEAPSVAATSDSQTTLAGKARLQGIVRNLIRSRNLLGPNSPIASTPGSQQRQRTISSTAIATDPGLRDEQLTSNTRVSRVASLIPALKCLQPQLLLNPHTALVRHLQFSPNGEYLATCSWDRTCLIFKVKDFSQPHRVLAHPQGFVSQVAWSPRGDSLLTKMVRGMKIWTTDSGVCRRTIDRQRSVQSVAWFPQGEAFLSVEGSDVTKLDINGKVIETYEFDRMVLHDVAITQDQQRMLCVATLTASPDGLKPSMSREEKQIIVYNLEKKEIENQVPVLHEVRDITLAKDGNVALVSYENKAPPQLWKLELLKDRISDTGETTARLSLVHTYMPKTMVEFAGPSYFGGQNDQLVICAGKAGDIHIWDRGSAFLLHSIKAQDLDGDMTCIAWNHAASSHAPASPHMFATGSHDGAVRIWTAPATVPARNSYIDLRQHSGATTPRTSTPDPATSNTNPQFIFEVTDRTESPANHDDTPPSPTAITPSRSRNSSQDRRNRGTPSPERRTITFANVASTALAAARNQQ